LPSPKQEERPPIAFEEKKIKRKRLSYPLLKGRILGPPPRERILGDKCRGRGWGKIGK